MSDAPVAVPEVVVEPDDLPLPPLPAPGPLADPDELSLIVDGRIWKGWKEVAVTRSCEGLPSVFQVSMTERFPGEPDLVIPPGYPCTLRMGKDAVLTGRIDRYQNAIDPRQHAVSITGRSKCRELVDCAAILPGWQINAQTIRGVAEKLAGFYDIQVSAPQGDGPLIPQLNLMPGETTWNVIERLARFGKLLAYDDTDGNLVLSAVGTEKHASGVREGVNAISATTTLSANGRFSEYWVYLTSTTALFSQLSLATGGNGMQPPAGLARDEGVPNKRILITHMEHAGPDDPREIAQKRAEWEAARRRGRAEAIKVRVRGWRDKDGLLWEPNRRIDVHVPACQVHDAEWVIGEVTYRRGQGTGTVADLTIMPKIAFDPLWVPLVPFNYQLQEAGRRRIEMERTRAETAQNRRSAPGP